MTVPRQQPHALAKFKHQQRTSAPKPVTVPAHMVPDCRWQDWDFWHSPENRGLTESERKRNAARAARKARK